MIWLIFSILCSVIIFVVFHYLKVYQIDNLQAIVVNYLTAFLLGQSQIGFSRNFAETIAQSWFPYVMALGIMFISLFMLMAWVSQTLGLAVVSVTVKMAVIMPVSFGIWYYQEQLNLERGIGIGLALLAVFLATYKPVRAKRNLKLVLYPLVLFLGSGLLDILLKYNQAEYLSTDEQPWFASIIFGTAGILGLIAIIFRPKNKRSNWSLKSVAGGLALGIPNYGSIYFLLRALDMPAIDSSIIFSLNNVGIVALSTLLGAWAFHQKLLRVNYIGITIAILSILLIGLEL